MCRYLRADRAVLLAPFRSRRFWQRFWRGEGLRGGFPRLAFATSPGDAGARHEVMQHLARATGVDEFAMGEDLIDLNAIELADEGDERAERRELCGRWGLHFDVPKQNDAQVVFIVAARVCPLIGQR